MEPITRLLFEQPYLQGLIVGLALLVAVAGWWWARFDPPAAKRWGMATLIILVLGAVGQVTARYVTTDRERIRGVFEQVRAAVANEDVAGLLAVTDQSLVADGRDRDQFERWLDGLFKRVTIEDPKIRKAEITLSGSESARATIAGLATIEVEGFKRPVAATWQFDLVKQGSDTWKIVTLKPVESADLIP